MNRLNTFFEIRYSKSECTRQMTDQEDNINLAKIVFDDNYQQRKSWACLGQTCSRSSIVFLFQLFVFFLLSLVGFGKFILQKFVTTPLFVWDFCVVQQDTFNPHQDYELFNFYKKSRHYIVGRSFRSGKILFTFGSKWNLSNKIWQNLLFYHHSQRLCDVMQKEIENLQFAQGVNFEFIDSLKNNGTKHLLIFDDSCEEIFTSKAFADVATAGRHRGLSIIYIRHNLFQKSNLEREVEHQNTHTVLFKSPRDVMQVSTLTAQPELGSKLVDWFWDATSVPYGHLLNDLSPRTDARLCYCTNTASSPSKFYIPYHLKQSKILDVELANSLYSPSVPIIFPQIFSFSLAQKMLSGFFANA